jgi:4-hydroxy-3-polyprenylbenzoate decarboxylase
VPATAEIVIEGYILPDAIAMEGPYGEYSGYRTGEMGRGVLLDVQAISFRDDPIHTMDCTGFKDDGAIVASLTGAIAVKRRLQRKGIPVADVYLPPEGAVHTAVVSVTRGGSEVTRAILDALTARRALLSKIVVVDVDVDVFATDEVLHAFSVRCHPGRGIHVGTYTGRANALTPAYSAEERGDLTGATVAFDCTWPPEWNRSTQVPVRASFAESYGEQLQRRVLDRWSELGPPASRDA